MTQTEYVPGPTGIVDDVRELYEEIAIRLARGDRQGAADAEREMFAAIATLAEPTVRPTHVVLVHMRINPVAVPADYPSPHDFRYDYPDSRSHGVRFVVPVFEGKSWVDVLDGYLSNMIGMDVAQCAAREIIFDPMRPIPGQVFLWGSGTRADVTVLAKMARGRGELRARIAADIEQGRRR
jgi:hypothetical protein